MSTHKHINKICLIVVAVMLVLTILFMNGEVIGIKKASTVPAYESRLFDTSTVHTIDIVIDDWDGFLETCTNEEYAACTVLIDNEAFKNVAIRAKGNTSLTQVSSYGNDRYSFKIEFDQYDSSKSYYGLDKLCLNNIIQDNTYMKDYLTYQLMGKFGVASPLCSYVYITVNGEDWGLYLAVEGVEDSFLSRNYGKSDGDLYKPDSQSMGGGRGNGKGFDFNDAFGDSADADSTEWTGMQRPDGMGGGPGGMGPPDRSDDGSTDSGSTGSERPDFGSPPDFDGENAPDFGNMPDFDSENMPSPPSGGGEGGFPMDGGPGGGSMGSDDVKLVYSDDEYDSYSNIFDNAKTDVTDSDRERLIESIKKMNDGEDIEDVVNVESVIRYFVVHNFVLNFDSYTGSMIHNYYLYESDGQMEMIPWDYNLAFGGFGSSPSDAASLVNYPIDTPVSGGTVDSRPMLAWILNSEEYTEIYHQYFSQFISEYFDSGYFTEMIDSVSEMIAPYVEKDPTKFCTYEEFETGVETLREFCLLRAESVSGQLDGTIPSTSDGQTQDSSSLVDASGVTVSDMGSMNMGGMGQSGPDGSGDGGMRMGGAPNGGQSSGSQSGDSVAVTQSDAQSDTGQPPDTEQNDTSDGSPADMSEGATDGESTQDAAENQSGQEPQDGQPLDGMQRPDGDFGGMPDDMQTASVTNYSAETWIWAGVSAGALLLGLVFVLIFKRRG